MIKMVIEKSNVIVGKEMLFKDFTLSNGEKPFIKLDTRVIKNDEGRVFSSLSALEQNDFHIKYPHLLISKSKL